MKRHINIFYLIFFTSSVLADVTPESCLDIHRSVGVSMTRAMVEDFGIQESDILLDKTKMKLLMTENLTEEMALFYAQQDLKEPVTTHLTLEQYRDIYKLDGSKNLIIKYDYENRNGKHNVFLGSSIINDDECSIAFKGYLIVKREF